MKTDAGAEFTDLERQLLDTLLADDDVLLAALRVQLKSARVSKRELDGVGFFTDLAVPDAVAPVSPSNFEIDDVQFELEGLEGPVGCILFLRGGLLNCLEGFTYVGAWPDSPQLRSLSYDTGSRRDPALLGKVWREGRKPSAADMALLRTRRPRIRSGRSLGSPLNARPLAGTNQCHRHND